MVLQLNSTSQNFTQWQTEFDESISLNFETGDSADEGDGENDWHSHKTLISTLKLSYNAFASVLQKQLNSPTSLFYYPTRAPPFTQIINVI